MDIKRVSVFGGTGFCGYWMHRTQPHELHGSYFGRAHYELGEWKQVKWDYIVFLPHIAPTDALALALRHGSRFLYASSGAAYEQQTEYADNKRKWEAECLESGADVVIARLFTFFGRRLDKHKAYTQFTESARKNETIRVTGNGKTVRSYLHGKDLGLRMWAVLLRGKSGDIYDIGSSVPITILELANKIIEREGSTSEIIIENGIDPVPYYMPVDTKKTKRLLNI